ncbi:YSIRK-targeted surface antigen transcriptional regulator [Enterococcus sp. DIV0421]|uniref:YSIRK-targeted surface antigen transcriptional regulator n=1 Tax=Enterococcus sp. DIV0421 TaxID=2774688 RepID=UPI003F26326F
MTITSNLKKKLKSLHVSTKIPISVYEKNDILLIKYDFHSLQNITNNFLKKVKNIDTIDFQYGSCNELFITLKLNDNHLILGPIKIQPFQAGDLSSEAEFHEYINEIPNYYSDEIPELLILIGFLFDIDLQEEYLKIVKDNVKSNSVILKSRILNNNLDVYNNIREVYFYEHKILALIAQGNLEVLKRGISEMNSNIIPVPTEYSVRYEKNYTIIIIEKLSNFTIQLGLDIMKSLYIRNLYLTQIESAENIIDVLKCRDSAVVHFTEELHEVVSSHYSQLIKQVLQYIHIHIYDDLVISDIAKYFYFSESSLRRKFKDEVGTNISSYVKKQKIIEAKMLLLSGMPPYQIATNLHFFDLPHFVRVFKKEVGITPKQFTKQMHFGTSELGLL